MWEQTGAPHVLSDARSRSQRMRETLDRLTLSAYARTSATFRRASAVETAPPLRRSPGARHPGRRNHHLCEPLRPEQTWRAHPGHRLHHEVLLL